jgi:hypothetical protein
LDIYEESICSICNSNHPAKIFIKINKERSLDESKVYGKDFFFLKGKKWKKIRKAHTEIGERCRECFMKTGIEDVATEGKKQRGMGFRFEDDKGVNK